MLFRWRAVSSFAARRGLRAVASTARPCGAPIRTKLQLFTTCSPFRQFSSVPEVVEESLEPEEELDDDEMSVIAVDSSSLTEALPTLEVLYQDPMIAIFNKPAGLSMHPSPMSPRKVEKIFFTDCAASQLATNTVFVVNRLDKFTSGIVIVARSPESASTLQGVLVDKSKCIKEYLTLVRGSAPDSLVETRPLTKHKHLDRRFRKYLQKLKLRNEPPPPKPEPQPAETRFETLSRFFRLSLIKARIITGRRHQIRRHLNGVAHQIIGDRQYGKGRINNHFRDEYGLNRMFLHSWRLQIPHPSTPGACISVQCGLPQELQELLSKLPERPEHGLIEQLSQTRSELITEGAHSSAPS